MSHAHAFPWMHPLAAEGLAVPSRRNLLKAGLAGLAGLSLPSLMQARDAGRAPNGKSVILLWMTGGPSHIDTWDPKPGRPPENRGPFAVIRTAVPGTIVCEHLPKQAAMMERFTLVRSVDARGSNHEPDHLFQTADPAAAPRVNPRAHESPSIASLVSRFHGPNHPAMPASVAFIRSRSHIAFAGRLGKAHDPFLAGGATRLPVYDLVGKDTGTFSDPAYFRLGAGLSHERLEDRRDLSRRFDASRRLIDSPASSALDAHTRRAIGFLAGRRLQEALDVEREPARSRERYGKHLWCQQALLCRRLVEAGAAFVTLDLSYHSASGTWDTHGDNIPPYGGISKGLKPLLPLFDHLLATLIDDLAQRGKLDDTLVIAMGEFGRTPLLGTQGSTDGRNHWPFVLSMCLAGGGLRHGQVIGSTDRDGGQVATRPVRPADLAATIYRHMGVPIDAEYHDALGRPFPLIPGEGKPLAELF